MSDPLSVIASVLTVAGLAATSCECLYKSVRRISQAPKDLQHHLKVIRALQSTFLAITTLAKDVSDIAVLVPGIESRIQACIVDLQAAEAMLTSYNKRLKESRTRRIWTKVRWSSIDQQEVLKSYLRRIESYYMTFSLDLQLINM